MRLLSRILLTIYFHLHLPRVDLKLNLSLEGSSRYINLEDDNYPIVGSCPECYSMKKLLLVPGRSRISHSRPSTSFSRPSFSPSHSSTSFSRPSYPSYPSFPSVSRPSFSSPSRPLPNYGWNIPSTPSRPSSISRYPSPSHSPSPSYGWNIPSRPPPPQSSSPSNAWKIPSRPSPSNSPSPSYGWNVPSKPSPSHSPSASSGWKVPSTSTNTRPSNSWSTSNSRPTPPPYTPKQPPNYGWKTNIPSSPAKSTNVNPSSSNPWSVPGRQTPVHTQATGAVSGSNKPSAPPIGWNPSVTGKNPSAPPSGGTVGWNPAVTNSVNSGVSRNPAGGNQANKKVIGSQQNSYPGPQKPYPTQAYGPSNTYNTYNNYHSNYQPGYRPGTYGYHPPSQTTIINNNYHSSSYYPSYGYRPPVYYPTYTYSYHDTGSTALGFYLGYNLAHLHTPTYHFYGHHIHDSYRPVYDHYTVHHYYHNSNTAPKQEVVQPNAIVMCVGDSGKVCPSGTHALCTSSGSIMCVASASSTQPCTDIQQTNCVRSTIPCWNSSVPECHGKKPEETTSINIPCIYTTKVLGNITYVNNTIILDTPPPSPNLNATSVNGTVTPGNLTVIGSTQAPMTTTPQVTVSTTPAQDVPRSKRDTNQREPEQQFCVTIIAQPAERKNRTDNELLIDGIKTIFSKFEQRAFKLPS